MYEQDPCLLFEVLVVRRSSHVFSLRKMFSAEKQGRGTEGTVIYAHCSFAVSRIPILHQGIYVMGTTV